MTPSLVPWILAVLGLYVFQVFLPAALRAIQAPDPAAARADHLRGKDNPPPLSKHGARAARALNNLQESLPVFLVLAILLEMGGSVSDSAILGAQVFLVGRVLFVPAYLTAVAGVRSLMWLVAVVGLGMMVTALL